jgi:hypothetical protein
MLGNAAQEIMAAVRTLLFDRGARETIQRQMARRHLESVHLDVIKLCGARRRHVPVPVALAHFLDQMRRVPRVDMCSYDRRTHVYYTKMVVLVWELVFLTGGAAHNRLRSSVLAVTQGALFLMRDTAMQIGHCTLWPCADAFLRAHLPHKSFLSEFAFGARNGMQQRGNISSVTEGEQRIQNAINAFRSPSIFELAAEVAQRLRIAFDQPESNPLLIVQLP